jgi:long-chain acyl-CoA synthetase
MNEKPWFKSYPEFVPREIDKLQYHSIAEIFDKSVIEYGDKPAFVNMDVELSFSQMKKDVDALCWYLQNHTSLKPGDRIAIQMPNLLQFPVAFYAAIKAGLVVVNTNPLYTAEEMRHQFNDAGVKGIIILENFASKLEEILKDTSIQDIVVTRIGDMLGTVKGAIINTVVKHVKKMVPAWNIPNYRSWKDALKLGTGKSPVEVKLELDDLALLQYTGGTTGVSKGAMLTHRNICSNVAQVYAWIGNLFQRGKETVITPLPLYHIFALTVNNILFMSAGFRNVLITNPRDMKAFLKDMKKNPPNYLTGVNTLFNGMMHRPEFGDIDWSHLKLSIGGGMAVQDAVAKEWHKKTGGYLLEGYGLSETSPVATVDPVDGSHRMGSIGLPVPSTDIKLVDDDGKEVEAGQRGEIAIKGPQVMKGYWNREDESEKAFKDGYFLTGDIGEMEDDGFFRIVDRKKEMINVSGFNVYPNEIEKVIAHHPGVLEVGVRGESNQKSGEVVKAFVVKKDPSLTEEDVIAFCREKLTSYKVPRSVVFRDELPKSNVGKILRRLLE